MRDHIQSVSTKLTNEKIKDITNDNATNKILFAASEADAEAWLEEATSDIKVKHCSLLF